MNDPTLLLDTLDQVIARLHQSQEEVSLDISLEETGRVIQVEKGVAFIEGLPNLKSGELVQFTGKQYGLAINLEKKRAGIVLLDRSQNIYVGMDVKRTNKVQEIGVGKELLGRVIDPLGRPLDHKKPPQIEKSRPIERRAPALTSRLPVVDPLLTGIQAIDGMIPIGRGQRELILGDRQTGKTAIAVDAILNQRDQGVICLYCAIGKETSEVQRVLKDLEENNALEYTIIIAASGKDSPGLNYIAPYATMAIAEDFMENGHDTLVVLDDLTRHAWSYREISLLLRRPPTREAYPGDIFFIHSRLLERATKLKKEKGGGSITALPIIETEEQNISSYIPTNLISITDGQIYLSPKLYQEGVLPSIDIGKSVSRVGGETQLHHYRRIVKDLRLLYSQYEELESFSRFGTRLDKETKKKLERGKRVREVLKQERLKPLSIADQIAFLTALTTGLFDPIALKKIHKLKQQIQISLYEDLPQITQKLNKGQEISEEEMQQFINLLTAQVQI
ncbi:MAG: F0F1 ATP synthase subunit alpha [Chlamydiae bacterium CG10_big_fil_rev_8_21_14_0_10_35_9]|nr:MAG: F0F1 ATP synthase subunit alpha [Chlamydiae bacterium CG10_big_fil_rev_8_21_14_0_10_35_9]